MELFRTLNEAGTTIIQVTHSEVNASYGGESFICATAGSSATESRIRFSARRLVRRDRSSSDTTLATESRHQLPEPTRLTCNSAPEQHEIITHSTSSLVQSTRSSLFYVYRLRRLATRRTAVPPPGEAHWRGPRRGLRPARTSAPAGRSSKANTSRPPITLPITIVVRASVTRLNRPFRTAVVLGERAHAPGTGGHKSFCARRIRDKLMVAHMMRAAVGARSCIGGKMPRSIPQQHLHLREDRPVGANQVARWKRRSGPSDCPACIDRRSPRRRPCRNSRDT